MICVNYRRNLLLHRYKEHKGSQSFITIHIRSVNGYNNFTKIRKVGNHETVGCGCIDSYIGNECECVIKNHVLIYTQN